MTSKKAIIIAAGRGSRLMPYTDEMPKCLVPVDQRSILAIQLEAFKAHGVEEVVVIRGYLGDVIERRQDELCLPVRFVDNREWQDNNILESLFCAEHELAGGSVFLSYSDIIFTPAVVGALAASRADISLVVDEDFRLIYEGRDDHPLPEAEVAAIKDGQVTVVGKRSLAPEAASGEFIGLAQLSSAGAAHFCRRWATLCQEFEGRREAAYIRAPSFRRAYLTDLLQDLIDAGNPVAAVSIHGEWREIDTVQDLTRARALLRSSPEDWK